MGRFFDLVNPPVHSLAEFASAMPVGALPDHPGTPLLKLNANESPYGPSPKAIGAARAAIDNMHWYPDDHALALRQKLAALHNVRVEQILVSNGTTSLLDVLSRTLLAPGRKA